MATAAALDHYSALAQQALAGLHPTIAAALAPHVLTPRRQVSLVVGIQARCGRRRIYPTQALADQYDRGWSADDLHGIEAGSPAADGFWDHEADLQARDDERREAADAWALDEVSE